MENETFSKIIDQWNGLKSQELASVSCDELVSFSRSFAEALLLDCDLTQFAEQLKKCEMLSTVCKWYSSAPYPLFLPLASLICEFCTHEELVPQALENNVIDVGVSRALKHPDVIYDVNAGLWISLTLGNNLPLDFIETMRKKKVPALIERACTLLLLGPSSEQDPGYEDQEEVDDNNRYAFPPRNGCKTVAPVPLPEDEIRIYLWNATCRLIVAFSINDTSFIYPSTHSSRLRLTTLLASCGTLEKYSVAGRQVGATYIAAAMKAGYSPALHNWLIDPSHAQMYAVMAMCNIEEASALIMLFLMLMVQQTPRNMPLPLSACGLLSSQVIHGIVNSAFVRSRPKDGKFFVTALSIAMERDRDATVTAVRESGQLQNLCDIFPVAEDIDDCFGILTPILYIMKHFYMSTDPRSLGAVVRSRLSFAASSLLIQILDSKDGLYIDPSHCPVPGLIRTLWPFHMFILAKNALFAASHRRAMAALKASPASAAAASASNVPDSPAAATGEGDVDWAAIAAGPFGKAGIAYRENLIDVCMDMLVQDGSLELTAKMLGAYSAGIVATSTDKFVRNNAKFGKIDPLLAAIMAQASNAIVALCPAAPAIATMLGGLPYAVWPTLEQATAAVPGIVKEMRMVL